MQRGHTMSNNPLAVVTGAYRGLGLETCRQLGTQGYTVILTTRREAEGRAAAEGLQAQGLDVRFHAFGRLNVLVNNAGIFPDASPGSWGSSAFGGDLEAVRRGLETNTLGPLRLCQILIPLMKGNGRVVNVSSGMGQLSEMNGCCPGYRLSKTALNAVTRIFADELKDTGVKVNSVCPGWVRTQMGGDQAPLSIEEGAKGIVWAATLSDDGPSGGFFRHGERIDW